MTVFKVAVLISVTALIHIIFVFLHAWAHLTLAVNMSWAQNAFIISVIMIAPIIAGVLIWTPFLRTGALIFTASMFGALIFGAYHHFLVPGMDHISRIPNDSWGALFRMTAILLAITEAWGSILGWWSFRSLSNINSLYEIKTKLSDEAPTTSSPERF